MICWLKRRARLMPSTMLAFSILKRPSQFAEEGPTRQEHAAHAGFLEALSDTKTAPWG